MTTKSGRRPGAAVFLAAAVLGLLFVGATVASSGGNGRSGERALTRPTERGSFEALEAADQYAEARTAPAADVSAGALISGVTAAHTLPVTGGPWNEVTTNRYDSDAAGYRDPVWSNSGGGAGLVAGRMTALAVDGSTVYAGAADGGVWRKVGNGAWQPLSDDADTLSIGALAVDPAHGLWVGTGEANTNSDSYAGVGVFYKAPGTSNLVRVGGNELQNHLVGRLAVDPGQGVVYAATSRGLYRHSLTGLSTPWTKVLGIGAGFTSCTASGGAPGVVMISDVAVKPGTNGQTVVAAVGWRAGSNCNGLFVSNDFGQHFARATVGGALNDHDLGRTTLAYSADGSKLYALVQSASMFNQAKTDFGGTLLQGIYASPSGSIGGPWNKIAEWRNLGNSGSALKKDSKGYHPGVQAWYNQFLAVDPGDANHLYVGLEEVFETRNGGVSWQTIGPYWNFGLCADLNTCPKSTHPDQHAIAISGSNVYVGNDGGVWSRRLDATTEGPTRGWTNLNEGLRTLQYYYAAAGRTTGGDAIWGGLQDNGVSLLNPGASTMVSPFGGDGGDNIVDPNNADRAVNEYTDLDMALTTNGGRSDGTTPAYREISPSCFAFTYTPSPCDPGARFIAPFRADTAAPNTHWIAGGQYAWESNAGWDTHCSASSCDWHIVYDTGAGHSITAIGVNSATYVGWCGPCNADGFTRGVATNYGGTWHELSLPTGFPNRFVNAVTVDPANPAHVYLVFNGFSRRWTNESSGEGHVFESTNGGGSWTDISGNLPDVPGDDILVTPSGKLVYAADVGVYTAPTGQGAATSWSQLGTGLPNASVNDLAFGPGNGYVIAGTHGRGLWKIATP